MGLLLSRRILPGIRLDLFAAFLDSARHGVEIGGINATGEAHEVPDWCSCGFGQAAREIQNLALVRSVQAVHLFDNFVFDRLCHNEINVSKDICNVKRAAFWRYWEPEFSEYWRLSRRRTKYWSSTSIRTRSAAISLSSFSVTGRTSGSNRKSQSTSRATPNSLFTRKSSNRAQ